VIDGKQVNLRFVVNKAYTGVYSYPNRYGDVNGAYVMFTASVSPESVMEGKTLVFVQIVKQLRWREDWGGSTWDIVTGLGTSTACKAQWVSELYKPDGADAEDRNQRSGLNDPNAKDRGWLIDSTREDGQIGFENSEFDPATGEAVLYDAPGFHLDDENVEDKFKTIVVLWDPKAKKGVPLGYMAWDMRIGNKSGYDELGLRRDLREPEVTAVRPLGETSTI
jgi:hypothetical protein